MTCSPNGIFCYPFIRFKPFTVDESVGYDVEQMLSQVLPLEYLMPFIRFIAVLNIKNMGNGVQMRLGLVQFQSEGLPLEYLLGSNGQIQAGLGI